MSKYFDESPTDVDKAFETINDAIDTAYNGRGPDSTNYDALNELEALWQKLGKLTDSVEAKYRIKLPCRAPIEIDYRVSADIHALSKKWYTDGGAAYNAAVIATKIINAFPNTNLICNFSNLGNGEIEASWDVCNEKGDQYHIGLTHIVTHSNLPFPGCNVTVVTRDSENYLKLHFQKWHSYESVVEESIKYLNKEGY